VQIVVSKSLIDGGDETKRVGNVVKKGMQQTIITAENDFAGRFELGFLIFPGPFCWMMIGVGLRRCW
jgi:hypothetical protein